MTTTDYILLGVVAILVAALVKIRKDKKSNATVGGNSDKNTAPKSKV
ncbi:FeoB-associated Cys-rich membrane protein [Alteromonas sp. RKMC-009]|nr:FeoB-associated Cys-rich membrane protein [Alteromonas sp. RKMC-009]